MGSAIRATRTGDSAELANETTAPDALPTSGAARWRWLIVFVCVLSVGLRLLAVAQFEAAHPLANHLVIDERSYDEWGARIAAGDWLGDEVFFQEPLYPYFLGVVYTIAGHDLHFLRIVQCLLGGLTTWLIWKLAQRAFGPGPACVAALGFALFPAAILMPCLVLKPNLFLPIFAAFLWIVLQRSAGAKIWLVAGALGALGALLRGNLLILLPAFALWPLLRREGLRAASRRSAAFGAGLLLVLLPVLLRNWHVGGVLAITTSGAGTNVYGGNNSENPYGIATEFSWVRGIPRYEANDWRLEAERRTGQELDAAQTSAFWMGEAWRSVLRQPGMHLSILWNKLRLALGGYEVPDNHFLEWDARYVPILSAGLPGFELWGGFGLAGVLLAVLRRKLRGEAFELAAVFVLYLGTIVLTVMSMRARLPLLVPLLPFTGFWFLELWRDSVWRRVGLTLATGVIGVGFATVPVFDRETREQDLSDRDYNLAASLIESGGPPELVAPLAEDLAQRYPRSSRVQTLLANTEWLRGLQAVERGDRAQGETLIDRALKRLRVVSERPEINPRERSRAQRLAAYIQAGLGNWAAAERFFARAREFASEDLELRVSHAQALLYSARDLPAGAEREAREARARALLDGVIEEAPSSAEAEGARTLLAEGSETGQN